MASGGKVVRIEDIASLPDRVRFREETFVFSEDGGRASKLHQKVDSPIPTSDSPIPTSDGLIQTQSGLKDKTSSLALQPYSAQNLGELEEENDVVGPLPIDWPQIPALFRRRSCELSTIMFPCVNKAVSHLELIQNIVEDWFSRLSVEDKSRQSSSRQSKSSKLSKGSRSHPTLTFESEPLSVDGRVEPPRSKSFTYSASSPSSAASSKLSVIGVGGRPESVDGGDSDTSDEEMPTAIEREVPFLGAEDVIEEVMTLLARLENDRQLTLSKLTGEEERVRKLQGQIERVSMRRLLDLPKLVQQEHEACILDVNELQWHVAYSSRSLDRIQNKTNIADVLNQRLKEDIGFVDKHIPLVQEKLELELEAMEKIRQAQLETNKELEVVLTRQAKTESKSREANDKAATERAYIKKELDTVRDELQQICDELSTAISTFNSYTHQTNDIIQKLKDNEQEKIVLQVKNENAKYAEEMQAVKVRDLETLITEAEFEHSRLTNENSQLQQDLDTKKSKHGSRIQELQIQLQQKENDLRRLTLKNKEVQMESQDCRDKITKCEKQKIADEKNMARIKKELVRTERQMESTMEDFRKVFAINNSLREQLKTDEEKAFKLEENLKQTGESLKRQVKDEVHTRTVLSARINSDSTDVSRTSQEVVQKKKKVSLVAEDVTSAVTQVEDKVSRLRSAQVAKAKKIADLKQKISEVECQQEDTDVGMEEQLKIFQPHHEHLKEDMLSFDKKLDHIAWRTEKMRKNMDDMASSSAIMLRVLDNTEKGNNNLEEELKELNIQLDSGYQLKNNLKDSMQKIEERIHKLDRQQREFISQRKQNLVSIQEQKVIALKLNKDFASRYRQLQNDSVLLKNGLLDVYEERISLENTIKDLKQLRGLQLRMHGALVEYFKFRGLYNEAEVDKLESESSNNASRVTELQADMNKALSSITRFLQTELMGENNDSLLPTVTPSVKGKTPHPRQVTVKS